MAKTQVEHTAVDGKQRNACSCLTLTSATTSAGSGLASFCLSQAHFQDGAWIAVVKNEAGKGFSSSGDERTTGAIP